MSLVLDTPVDRTVSRIAAKVRLLRLEYSERRVLIATFQMVSADGKSLELTYVSLKLDDPNLFARTQTLNTIKDFRTMLYAHAQNAGLFGTGVDDNEV